MTDIWPTVHAERIALADDLELLTPEQWTTPSLCPGWDVHDVVAHLVATAKTTPWIFIKHFAAAGFDFDKANANEVADERKGSQAETLAAFRAVQFRTSSPPAPKDTRLVEAFVHGEDIRRPLGIVRDYPVAAVVRALALQARTSVAMGGGKDLIAGLTVTATDAEFTSGTGPTVEGSAISLLMAVSGRRTALADLNGPGKAVLEARYPASAGD
ncbi:maleylpyruvate isomerase family mycothiol-dependent enzyme [Arthrobacter tecti]